jgi:hypothetical protein
MPGTEAAPGLEGRDGEDAENGRSLESQTEASGTSDGVCCPPWSQWLNRSELRGRGGP